MTSSGRILWCGVARKCERSTTLLAEAGQDNFDGEVINLAKKLLKKTPTGGWEFERSRKKKLRGVNFYVHESKQETGEWEQQQAAPTIWVFSAIAESSLDEKQQKSFLEKLLYLTEPCREEDYLWREGDALACQELFAPMLLQRMEQVEHQGKLAMVNKSIESTKDIMHQNINMMMEREERLEDLETMTAECNIMAKTFKQRSKQIKRYKKWNNAKHGVLVGTAVTGVVAAVTVPPLVAAFL
mmetsp:Transcript_3527/g.6099  ORF Transcript_3527/g.6099 Transcript_3527/m.6099 type:complete len:242 (-) Transcript_3527:1134-1859(-)|eukprot:CAMPEP_0197715408 /NCGR_PEP_ID=MMETSP1434-20131217/579_1 /TAXON_ID=265543 /ORGANISM="Minutocellus polymorphus, Strain CCMP3303" /LENGTH=241 /DNA_ID=CAMNT_0043299501 /DNA_START=36 /DNA_END=761 /DNA_ORIENTATION=+